MTEKTQEIRPFEHIELTDIGLVRSNNEDNYLYAETVNGTLFGVFDGMGGHEHGEKAAQLAAETIRVVFERAWHDDIKQLINNAIVIANTRIRSEFTHLSDELKPGTTAVLVLIRDSKVYFAHCGDSRLYLASAGSLIQLTKDHSVVREMIDSGLISEKEAATHPRRNEITNALGIYETVEATIYTEPLYPLDNDMLMLCTDGLNGMISEKKIRHILSAKDSLNAMAESLVTAAKNAGGSDNITVILVRFFNTGNKQDKPVIQKQAIRKKYKLREIFIGIAFILIVIFGLIRHNTDHNSSNHASSCRTFSKDDTQPITSFGLAPEQLYKLTGCRPDSSSDNAKHQRLFYRIDEKCLIKNSPDK